MAPFARRTFAETEERRRPRRPDAGRPTPRTADGAASDTARAAPAPLAAYFYDLYRRLQRPGAGPGGASGCSKPTASEVVLPEQRASGIPEMLYGYADAARETAEFNVDAVLPR